MPKGIYQRSGLCPKCGLAERHVGPTGKKFGYCQKCHNELSLKRHREHPEEHRNMHLKSKYGLSPEEFADILVFQNGRCAICKTAEPRDNRNRWCVDHNHQTKEVRGILCDPCNVILGYHERLGIPVAKEFLDYLQNPPARSVLKREQKVLLFAAKGAK